MAYSTQAYIQNLGHEFIQQTVQTAAGPVQWCSRHGYQFATGATCPACMNDATITGSPEVLQN